MNGDELLRVEDLSVHAGERCLLRGVSFALRAGDALTVLGESGAGKSLLAQAVIGNLPAGLRAGGCVVFDGERSRADQSRARRRHWGRRITLLPQEPALALDPLLRIAPQLADVHRWVRGEPLESAAGAAARTLRGIGLADAAGKYPWQISGGMAQRAAAAIAQAGGARVLLVDEPTKGLDTRWREHVVATLQAARRAGACVLVITHDLRVARALGGQLIVLRAGEVVEQGDAAAVLAAPRHDFTRALLAADPARWPKRRAADPGATVLQAEGLAKRFGEQVLFDGLDLHLRARERLVLQGPSGTGKSTLGNVLLGLLLPDRGRVQRAPGLAAHALQKLYQDPLASFAPQLRLAQSLRDAARRHGVDWSAVQRHLQRLGVPDELLARRPAQVSGGELQRVALARVLMVRPALLFADEPTSRLDPLTQHAALGAMLDAIDDSGAALVLVTHDDDIAAAVGTRTMRLREADGEPECAPGGVAAGHARREVSAG